MDLRELPSHPINRHPWEKARARFFSALAAREVARGRPLRVLDVGAGDGYLARVLLHRLPARSSIVCLDSNYTREHLERLASGSDESITFGRELPAERFDLVLLLDVLEHVVDHHAFLTQLTEQALEPRGQVLVSVPAFMALYTAHDAVLEHHRRYSGAMLDAALGAAGLRAVAQGGLFYSLLAPRALAKAAELVRGVHSRPPVEPSSEHADTGLSRWSFGAVATAAVDLALAGDTLLSRLTARSKLRIPGLSLWALAERSVV